MQSQNPFETPEFRKMADDFKRNMKNILLIVLGVFILGGIGTSFYTVEPEEEAVVIRLGKYIGTYSPGLHFKIPLGIDSVVKIKTTKVHQSEFGFRKNNRSGYSNYDKESLMLTGDLNVADVEWVVQFSISDPYKFIYKTSSPERNIRDVSESIMRRVVGDRLVTEVLTTGRVEIASEAKVLMQELLDKYDMGVSIKAVKLQDVNPPDTVKPSFNEVNEAKQEQEKVINQAEEQYNKVIPEARGKAEKLISEAEGYGGALINRSKGDANKFYEVLKAYKKSPQVTKNRIYIETMEAVFASFSDVTIVDPKIKGLMPIYSNGQLLNQGK